MNSVILTGGSGYIGTAITEALLDLGIRVINFDIANPRYNGDNRLYDHYKLDLSRDINYTEVISLIKGNVVLGVIHLAAWKDLPESYKIPSEYYRNNIVSLINALFLAKVVNAKNFIFSSSAGVYSDDLTGAVTEEAATAAESPYGFTKLVGERIVIDSCEHYGIKPRVLRYFNPVGATKYAKDESDSLFGSILNCVRDNRCLKIFGNDWDTKDGTCIRDFIDIRDLANAHIHFLLHQDSDIKIINVGTGHGTTILDVARRAISVFFTFKYEFVDRREGDSVGCYADTTKLNSLGFKTKYSIFDSLSSIKDQLLK